MIVPGNKHVVCITGNVWSGSRSAPRKLLVREGFRRPTWFTTGQPITDAEYDVISSTDFHLSRAEEGVLAHMEFAGSDVGILKQEFERVLAESLLGALVVGPQEIAAQVAEAVPQTVVFSLKDETMDLSPHLEAANSRGQVRRIDVDILAPGVWTAVHAVMADALGLAP
jgi:hypothetical protein